MTEIVEIQSRDYWFKVVDFLQQNWALIDPVECDWVVRFFGDTGGVFDELRFLTLEEAHAALRLNGFKRVDEAPEVQNFLHRPEPPFVRQPHPNGPIYSSGQFWKSK